MLQSESFLQPDRAWARSYVRENRRHLVHLIERAPASLRAMLASQLGEVIEAARSYAMGHMVAPDGGHGF